MAWLSLIPMIEGFFNVSTMAARFFSSEAIQSAATQLWIASSLHSSQ
jgi:hypothetical protein